MSYSTTIQLTLFQNLDSSGKAEGKAQYGYRIYSDHGSVEYNNAYDSRKELLDDVNENTLLDYIKENHPDFYDTVTVDGGFNFNDEQIDLEDLDDSKEHSKYEEEYTEELFDGDQELEEEVQEILEEAAEELI